MAKVITKSYKKDIFCIEGHWERDLRKTDSIQPALKLLHLNLGVKFYYQRSATLEEIAHVSLEYSKKKYSKFIIYYYAFHGLPNTIQVGNKHINLEELSERLEGKLEGKIIHFGCCQTLGINKRRLTNFLNKTGALAISGYTKDIDFLKSTVLDILYFQNCQYWQDIRKIDSDMNKYYRPLVKSLGFRMVYRET